MASTEREETEIVDYKGWKEYAWSKGFEIIRDTWVYCKYCERAWNNGDTTVKALDKHYETHKPDSVNTILVLLLPHYRVTKAEYEKFLSYSLDETEEQSQRLAIYIGLLIHNNVQSDGMFETILHEAAGLEDKNGKSKELYYNSEDPNSKESYHRDLLRHEFGAYFDTLVG
jgi:hypothetical protein